MGLIIFGSGRFYNNRKEHFYGQDVIAFLDNATSKWGNVIDGVEILPPGEITNLSFDCIVIMMDSQIAKDVYNQLVHELYIDPDKILYFNDYLRKYIEQSLRVYYSHVEQKFRYEERCLIIARDLGYDGGSLAAVYGAKALQMQGYQTFLLAPSGNRDFIREMNREGITILLFPILCYAEWDEIYWIKQFQYVIINTYPMIHCACLLKDKKPGFWWIHEAKEVYKMVRGPLEDSNCQDISDLNIYAVSKIAKDNFEAVFHKSCSGVLSYGIPDCNTGGGVYCES